MRTHDLCTGVAEVIDSNPVQAWIFADTKCKNITIAKWHEDNSGGLVDPWPLKICTFWRHHSA